MSGLIEWFKRAPLWQKIAAGFGVFVVIAGIGGAIAGDDDELVEEVDAVLDETTTTEEPATTTEAPTTTQAPTTTAAPTTTVRETFLLICDDGSEQTIFADTYTEAEAEEIFCTVPTTTTVALTAEEEAEVARQASWLTAVTTIDGLDEMTFEQWDGIATPLCETVGTIVDGAEGDPDTAALLTVAAVSSFQEEGGLVAQVLGNVEGFGYTVGIASPWCPEDVDTLLELTG